MFEDAPFWLWLQDWNENWIIWGSFHTIDLACTEWREIAGRSSNQFLWGFKVTLGDTGRTVYEGDYTTDEC